MFKSRVNLPSLQPELYQEDGCCLFYNQSEINSPKFSDNYAATLRVSVSRRERYTTMNPENKMWINREENEGCQSRMKFKVSQHTRSIVQRSKGEKEREGEREREKEKEKERENIKGKKEEGRKELVPPIALISDYELDGSSYGEMKRRMETRRSLESDEMKRMIKGLTTSENTGKMREREKEKEKEVNKNVMSGNRTDVGSGGIRLGGNGGNGQREEIEMMDRRMRFTTAVGLGRVEEEKKKYRVSGVESIDQAIKAAQSSRLLLAAHTAQGALTVQGAHTIQGAQGTQTAQGQQISPERTNNHNPQQFPIIRKRGELRALHQVRSDPKSPTIFFRSLSPKSPIIYHKLRDNNVRPTPHQEPIIHWPSPMFESNNNSRQECRENIPETVAIKNIETQTYLTQKDIGEPEEDLEESQVMINFFEPKDSRFKAIASELEENEQ